ncbi:MAG TPA: NAD(P)-dependent oxidoreductase [Bacillota bacterium]|nr:NAD(P)-dependent oxidoreductase [Bacillota bacterium]
MTGTEYATARAEIGLAMLEDFERNRVDSFFKKITGNLAVGDPVSSLVITHLLPERPSFLRAVGRVSDLRAVLPKPKSVDPSAHKTVTALFPCDPLNRDQLSDAETSLAYLESRAAGERLVLIDIGGYFAPSLASLCASFSGELVGVIEDTENGLRRYLDLEKLPCPVYSVARSPLKSPEDYLVGQSIVFSAEALIRSRGDVLPGRPACVIGFGRLGSSIARMLHTRNMHVTVYDDDPIQRAHALAHGFQTAHTRADAIRGAGIVVCATGNLALREDDFARLANGAYIVSVTSSDDELELAVLDEMYHREIVVPHITRYATTGHYFYVLNDGNAVNFLHGASVGAFIFLVQAEILAALSELARQPHETGLHEVSADIRRLIAATWLTYFNGRP